MQNAYHFVDPVPSTEHVEGNGEPDVASNEPTSDTSWDPVSEEEPHP